jgi:hypothetical protein
LALACRLLFRLLTAVTVTAVAVVTEGAVNRPLVEIVPALAHQFTVVPFAYWTTAENCCVWFEVTVALVGEIEMLGCRAIPFVFPVEKPQDDVNAVRAMSRSARLRPCTGRPAVRKL